MRICGRCHQEKPLEGFHLNKNNPLGRAYWCKECFNTYNKLSHRKAHRPKPGTTRKWRQSKKGRATLERYKESHAEDDNIRHKANVAIARLVKKGVIKKMPCEICGFEKTEAHHPDYSRLIEIVWLCQSHHYKANRESKE